MDFNNIAQNFIEQYGLISIFLIVMLEYANVPLPSEVVLPFVGVMIANGNLNFILAVIVSIVGGVVGCIINYLIGLYFGKPILKYMMRRFPKTQTSIKSSMWWIDKYGKVSVMLARVIPIARTMISIPAGIIKMNLSIFILYSTVGISLWNFILIFLGYMLGDNLSQIAYIMKNYSLVVVFVLLIVCLSYCLRSQKNKI